MDVSIKMRIVNNFIQTMEHYVRFIFLAFLMLPSYAYSQEIVITEVMFNPNGNENVREFVEILNLSEVDIPLEGFLIGDGTGFDLIIPAEGGSWIVPKGAFALIIDPDYFTAGEPYSEIPATTPLFTVDDSAIGNRGLSNSTAEPVYLISAEGDTLSVVNYSLDCSPGHSWEKIIPHGGESMDNFKQSIEEEGTPGKKNSVTPPPQNPALDEGSIRFNPLQPQMNDEIEIIVSYRNAGLEPVSDVEVKVWILPDIPAGMADFSEIVKPGEISEEVTLFIDALPGGRLAFTAAVISDVNNEISEDDTVMVMLDVAVPTGTIFLNEVMAAPEEGDPEWIELYNQKNTAVDLYHWNLSDSKGTPIGLITEHVFIAGKGYAVISGGALNYDVPDISPVVIVDNFPALNNDGDTVKLFDFTKELVDSMVYEEVSSGYSFELISTEMSGDVSGWDISVNPRGATPGTLNSIDYPTTVEGEGSKTGRLELSVTPNPFSDMATISYSLPFPLARVRLYVYDRRGRLIIKLRDSDESGSTWTGTWDGRNNGSQLPAGPYILNFEVLDKRSGKVFNERKTIVIGRIL